jgi:transposase
MAKRDRRKFTNEQKAQAVKIVRESGKPLAHVARDLDVSPSLLRSWVNQAAIDTKKAADGPLTTEERAELARLRREVKTLQMERDFLKRASAFFAKDAV